MTKIALIGCTSIKEKSSCPAVMMYKPSLYFRLRLKYAVKKKFDFIYILSAKYGLLELNTKIKPYNLNLKDCSEEYKRKWSYIIAKKLDKKHDLDNDCFYILAGNEYMKYLKDYMRNFHNPVKHCPGMGGQIKCYKKLIEVMK